MDAGRTAGTAVAVGKGALEAGALAAGALRAGPLGAGPAGAGPAGAGPVGAAPRRRAGGEPDAGRAGRGRVGRLLPGVAAAALVAALATALGGVVPVVGAPVIAIVAGIVVAAVRPVPAVLGPGLACASRGILQASIVVLGANLSVSEVVATGRNSLPVLAGTLVLALVAAAVAGRCLRLRSDLTVLIGVGTAVCGASAIAAADSVIEADDADVSYAMATIFAFNVVAVLAYPALGHVLGLSQRGFGLWAGTAVNDMSSVVATTTAYGHPALAYGVVVKLARTLAIIPICLGLAAWRGRRPSPAGGRGGGGAPARAGGGLRRVFPVFILGFAAAAALNTAGAVPPGWHRGVTDLSTWMITTALAAVGLSTRPRALRAAGARPMALGAILWALVGVTSLGLQALVPGL